jgi:uncharacterized membrane protein HdeD (DUF308 family)
MELLWIYLIGMFLFTVGVAVYALYKHKYPTEEFGFFSTRFDVYMGVFMGFLVSTFWPLCLVILAVVFLANRILGYLVAHGKKAN